MAIRKILTEPDQFLRQKSKEVGKVDKEIQNIMDDMLETMYNAPGIGLAAIQVGVPKRIIVIDLSKEDQKKNPLYFVNPEIISRSDQNAVYEEGCLSVPNQFAEIDRPDKCHIKFLDYDGVKQLLKAEGLLATCIQHEIDHLEGILFIDYLSKLKKGMIIKKLSKQKKSLERIAF
ncbi:MAG: peptide deformylase [Pelagibacterales bacterium]|mgnify:CR=1 FL=1|jgi:peptide deformylase|nr:peptide deformylase [Pelagibacterales bacterium]